jgi:uncharacterized surface protein with fasciclin (FAS1) repeats
MYKNSNNPYKKFRFWLMNGFIFVLSVAMIQACDDDDDSPSSPGPGTVVEVAQSDDDFSELVSALQDAGLVSTLEGNGPFTVFAPTNDAFQALPSGTVQGLTTQELVEILSYHVISGEVTSGNLQAEQTVDALAGGQLFVTVDGNLNVNDSAGGVTLDIDASNGVIHAIDGVLFPDRFLDVVGIITKRYTLQSLEEAVIAANLVNTLQQDTQDGYTVFAPTVDIPTGSLSQQELEDILTYHVLDTEITSANISSGTQTTVNGADLQIDVATDGSVTLTDQAGNTYNVTTVDLQGTNGVVHLIDGILMPN